MFMVIAGSSPLRKRVTGVRRVTFAGVHCSEEYPGTNKYSLNV